MDPKEAQRLRALDKENAELKGLLADQLFGDRLGKKL